MPDARSDDGRSRQPFDQHSSRARKASPLRIVSTSILLCQLHPIALFHLGATMKSSKFPSSKIVIYIRAKPNNELSIQFASPRTIVLVKDTIEARESDAILAAQMLQSAVFRELHGKLCKCSFECDSDIGCRHCIRSDLNALPGHMPSQQRNASAEIAWIADTGSAQDLVCSKMIPDDIVYHSHEPLELITANGSQSAGPTSFCSH